MTQNSSDPKSRKTKDAAGRDDRLKAALKANMARRKAQAKARADLKGARGGQGPAGGEDGPDPA